MKTCPSFYLITIWLACSLLSHAALKFSVKSGAWHDPSTWGGAVPHVADSVNIRSGHTITLNSGTYTSAGITVEGTLFASRTHTININTPYLIANGGQIDFGKGLSRFTGKLTLTLTGSDQTIDILSMGTKVLGATNGGELFIHGKSGVKPWTKLEEPALKDDTSLTLIEPVNWVIGDKIVVVASGRHVYLNEVRTITSVSSDKKTISFSPKLNYDHTSDIETHTRSSDGKTWTLDRRGEVGLLTRNITIQGDASSETSKFGGHTIVMPGSRACVDGAAFYRMGQARIIGRYPFHWHMVANGASGQYFTNSAVWRSYNKAITVHGTNAVIINDNVFHDHLGHGIFIEDGGERFNLIKRNLISGTFRPPSGSQAIPSDNSHDQAQNRSPGAVWITNPNNDIENNVVAGTHGTGYWFIFPDKPIGPSSSHGVFSSLKPREEALGSFRGNVAHAVVNGIDMFDRLGADHSIDGNWGWNPPGKAVFQDITLYGCDTGVYCGLNFDGQLTKKWYEFNNLISADHWFHNMHAERLDYTDSVFIARTPDDYWSGTKNQFYRHYDGHGNFERCHFVGFRGDSNQSYFSTTIESGAQAKSDAYFSGITTDNNQKIPMIYNKVLNFDWRTEQFTNHFHDLDGSLTGYAGRKVVPDHPMLRSSDDVIPLSYQSARLSRRNIGTMQIVPYNEFTCKVRRSKAGTPDAYGHHDVPHDIIRIATFLDEDYEYTYFLDSLPASKTVYFKLNDAPVTSSAIVKLYNMGGFIGARFGLGASAVPRASTIAAMKAANTNTYYLDPNGDAYLKIFATNQNVYFTWTGNHTAPAYDLDFDGDGVLDSRETALNRNTFSPRDFYLSLGDQTTNFYDWNFSSHIPARAQTQHNHMLYRANGIDPYIYNDKFNFDGSQISAIEVNLQSQSTGKYQLFWATEDGGYSQSRSVFSTEEYIANTGMKKLRFHLYQHPEWHGHTITDLRLDFPAAVEKHTWIDYIKAIDASSFEGLDTDADGVKDIEEGIIDTDGDGTVDYNDLDSDNDGASDLVENIYSNGRDNRRILVGDHLLDSDNDGESDLFEMIAGFSPMASSQKVGLDVSTHTNGKNVLKFKTGQNRKYSLLRSRNLTNWSPVYTIPNTTNNRLEEYIDPDSTPGEDFYKIEVKMNY